MPTTTRLATALEQARQARHHPACTCGSYRAPDGAPYCSSAEFRWTSMVNRMITTVCQEQSKPAGTSIEHFAT